MKGRAIMVLGTGSHVGKSRMVTAFCRLFRDAGLSVAPFKSQNMALNAYVTRGGGEMGYAQALQAWAAKIEPTVDMNPVLLKPTSDHQSQVIMLGRAVGDWDSAAFRLRRELTWQTVTQAYDRLAAQYEVLILEGAGSPVELNLMGGDVANLAMARYAGARTILVGDIDRGGVFASLLGTLDLMPKADRCQVAGLLINKFRGDMGLFEEGRQILAERAKVPVLGVIPFWRGHLPEEDGMALEEKTPRSGSRGLTIGVIRVPHIANFTDFDALMWEPGVEVVFLDRPPWSKLDDLRVLVIPGSKNTPDDLAYLWETGIADAVRGFAASGGEVVGICGGLQMLGQSVWDPDHRESRQRSFVPGLGLLSLTTVLRGSKTTVQTEGRSRLPGLQEIFVRGYELHAGRSEVREPPAFELDGPARFDGARRGTVWGTYLHGIFDSVPFRHAWLRRLGWNNETNFRDMEQSLADWAEVVRQHVDWPSILALVDD